MISAGGEKRGAISQALHQLKTQHTVIERQSPVYIRNLEVDVTDPCTRVDWFSRHSHYATLRT